jgi:hypothetical protein
MALKAVLRQHRADLTLKVYSLAGSQPANANQEKVCAARRALQE